MTDVNNICVNLREVPKLATTESLYRFCNPESTPPQYETNYHYIKATTEYTKKEKKKKEPSLKTKEIETKVENFNIDEMIPSIERPHSLSTSAYNDSKLQEKTKLSRQILAEKVLIPEKILKKLIRKHDISRFFSKKLRMLSDFKIVFILDDSGSMNEKLDESPLNRGSYKASRWDELQEFMRISIELASVLNEQGCDVYFLNRPMVKNIVKFEDLKRSFKNRPSGLTPITAILHKVLKNNLPNEVNEPKKLLTIIVTDGEPTNTEGRVDIKGFKECLITRPSNVYTTILVCTDEDNSMEYLNNWDKYIKRLDVVDDFRSERGEIMRSQGSNFHFTYGDYVVKSLIGSTDPSIDNLDENRFKCCRIL